MNGVLQNIDRLEVVFDDESLVADGGLLLAATLMDRLGLEALVDEWVQMGGRAGGARPGRKVLTLVASMLAGGSHIDHADRLRAGSTGRVLGYAVMAPSTLGTFLRAFTPAEVAQLDEAVAAALRRVWAAGGGPDPEAAVTLDLDSTICEVSGTTKEGAAYGYTKVLGYHPLVATRADTAEIVACRLREGSSQEGNVEFAAEAIGRVRGAGATGPVTLRADSGFWSYDLFSTLKSLGVGWSVTTPLYANVRKAIAAIDEDSWTSIDYPQDGRAQVAETTIWATHRTRRRERIKLRLVIRRTRIVGDQAQLWPDWRYHTFVTNLDQPTVETDQHHHPDSEHPTVETDRYHHPDSEHPTVETDRYHRHHASVELAIRDLKNSAGLTHLPSGRFDANAAWLLCASLAHNLYRWITQLGRTQPAEQLTVGTTIRTRLFGIPARIVNHSGRYLLRLPARWPWAKVYQTTLANLRALPQRC